MSLCAPAAQIDPRRGNGEGPCPHGALVHGAIGGEDIDNWSHSLSRALCEQVWSFKGGYTQVMLAIYNGKRTLK